MKVQTAQELINDALSLFRDREELAGFINVSEMSLRYYEVGRFQMPFTAMIRLRKEIIKRKNMEIDNG